MSDDECKGYGILYAENGVLKYRSATGKMSVVDFECDEECHEQCECQACEPDARDDATTLAADARFWFALGALFGAALHAIAGLL
jgi:hypothetical protein